MTEPQSSSVESNNKLACADVSALPLDTLEFANRMFDAAREGNTELVLSAVDAGLPANLTNAKGNTLLMLSAYAGHTDLTKGLLQKGSDPNRINDLGQSIVAGAVFKGHDEIVRALMEKGADPRGGTPNAIQAAYMFKREELMEVLGAKDEDFKDVPGRLPSAGGAP